MSEKHHRVIGGAFHPRWKCPYCGEIVERNPSYQWNRFCSFKCKTRWWNASRVSNTTKIAEGKILILAEEEGIERTELETILGTVLGDGSIRKPSNAGRSCLRLTHKRSDSDYLLWKMAEMPALFRSDHPITKRETPPPWTGTLNTESRASTLLGYLRKLFYSKGPGRWSPGPKRVPRAILRLLGSRALAVWYMDDGCRGKKRRDIKFCTDSFSLDDVIRLQTRLHDFGIESTMYKSRGRHHRINLSGANAEAFIKLVLEHIVVPSMNRKL